MTGRYSRVIAIKSDWDMNKLQQQELCISSIKEKKNHTLCIIYYSNVTIADMCYFSVYFIFFL